MTTRFHLPVVLIFGGAVLILIGAVLVKVAHELSQLHNLIGG